MPREFTTKWFAFNFKGHPNVRATHRTTLEITREDYLTPRGDCIIGVSSEAALADLPEWLKNLIREGSLTILVLCAGDVCDSIVGWGDPRLALDDPTRIIVRRSTHVDGKTLMIRASKSARDLDRRLVALLSRGVEGRAYITAIPADDSEDLEQPPVIVAQSRLIPPRDL